MPARFRTVPNAVRLGSRTDPPEARAALAVAVARDHVLVALALAALLVPDRREAMSSGGPLRRNR